MSNIYHIAVIDGKLTYEGDEDKYGIEGSGTATNLEQLCKVYDFGPNGYCFQNIYNQYPIFKIPIQKSKPMSFGCYVMEKGTSSSISNNYIIPLVANAEGYAEFSVQLSDSASRGRIGARVRRVTYTISDGRPSYYNTWYQLVLTKDEKDIWRFFVDGNLIGSVTNDVSLGTLDLWVNTYAYASDTNTYIQDVFAVDYCIADKNFTWEIKKNLPNYETESLLFPKLYQY